LYAAQRGLEYGKADKQIIVDVKKVMEHRSAEKCQRERS